MKKNIFTVLVFGFFLGLAAADKLAVAEPVNMGGAAPDELQNFWNILEANAGGGQYELITRAALQSMLTEIGLTEDSGLTDLSSAQKAKLGSLKTVKYILVSRLGRAGSRYTVTLAVIDASTGEIRPDQKISETYNSFAEVSDKLKNTLRKIGIGPAIRSYGRSVVLAPVFRISQSVPAYLPEEISVNLENSLLENGMKIQNLKSVEAILRKNGIGNLAEAEPSLYTRIGDLLEVDCLIQVLVTRFSIREQKKYIEVSRVTAIRHLGDISGSVRIISAQTGDVIQSSTFAQKMDFDELDDDTTDWEAEDYGRRLVQAAIPEICRSVVERMKNMK